MNEPEGEPGESPVNWYQYASAIAVGLGVGTIVVIATRDLPQLVALAMVIGCVAVVWLARAAVRARRQGSGGL